MLKLPHVHFLAQFMSITSTHSMCVLEEPHLGYIALLWVLPTPQSFLAFGDPIAIVKIVVSMFEIKV